MWNVHSKVFDTGDHFYSSTTDLQGGALPLLKSFITSFVFPMLSIRLFALHHSSSSATSCLHSDSLLWETGPTTTVSSANFTIWLLGWVAEHSCVRRLYNRGLRAHPWGEPVLRVMEVDVISSILTFCGLLVRKSSIQLQRDALMSSCCSLLIKVCGILVLNAELKSKKSNLVYKSLVSCVRAAWRIDYMASEVDRFSL